uniref:F-box and regulator of chromosome condensation repeat protein n=1 Tax=Pithovirus LCPAC202 TaxID=2506592 RepID=A0A481Z6A2_9VIRU|nr:MAG: F-box and regulator of chromosome condensation repeat protein [Pithovirus LCPAC202]
MDPPPNLSIDYLDLLPNEILIEILLKTDDLDTLSRWCRTSKRVNNICQDEFFWKRKYRKDFGEMVLAEGETWKESYKRISTMDINSPISIGGSSYGIIDQKRNLYMVGNMPLLGIAKQVRSTTRGSHLVKFPSKFIFKVLSKVLSISVGKSFVGAVTADGKAYLWGHNVNNMFRLKDNNSAVYFPREIILQRKAKAIKIEVSDKGYIILLEDHSVYLRIIYGTYEKFFWGFLNMKAIDVSIGTSRLGKSRYAIITKDRKLYISDEFERLRNLDTLTYIKSPGLVRRVIVNEPMMILSTAGDVYFLGGMFEISSEDKPKLIKLPEPIVQISTNGKTYAALSKTGKLYMWGSNMYGQISSNLDLYKWVGQTNTGWEPVRVKLGYPINYVSVGGYFTIAVTNDKMLNYWGDPDKRP